MTFIMSSTYHNLPQMCPWATLERPMNFMASINEGGGGVSVLN